MKNYQIYQVCLLLVVLFPVTTKAQAVRVLYQNDSVSFRGLSVVSDEVIWVSGSRGMVGRSIDGGNKWNWVQVPGFEKRDFRDIEAFDNNTAIIMAISEPANLLKTTDGGKTWRTVYTNSAKGMFLDAMDFNGKAGIVIGDPVDSRFFLARTSDGGDHWEPIPDRQRPLADSGEACFASSGSNISLEKNGRFRFVTGGTCARLFANGEPTTLRLLQGLQSTGANSLTVHQVNGETMLAVAGGDFANDKQSENNCSVSVDGGKTWRSPAVPPQGYRSSIIFLSDSSLLACGTSGIDISSDKGLNWKLVSGDSYHVAGKSKKGQAVFLAGSKGKIGLLERAIY